MRSERFPVERPADCGERIDVFKTGGGKTLAEEMNVPFLGAVPIDPEIVTSGDAGTPFVDMHMQGASGTAFAEIVRNILVRQEPEFVTTAIEHDD